MKHISNLAMLGFVLTLAGCAGMTKPQPVFTKPGITTDLSGVWIGAEHDDDTSRTRPVELDLRINDLGRVKYSTAGCEGLVKYQRHEDQSVVLLEQIQTGVGTCPRNSYLRLTPNEDGSMRFAHFDLEGKRTALGEIRKSSDISRKVNHELDAMVGTWTGKATTADGRSSNVVVNITPYARSSASYSDFGCSTELRHGSVEKNAVSTMETPVKGNLANCADGVVSYVLLPNGKLARMNYQPGRGSFNTTYLTKAK